MDSPTEETLLPVRDIYVNVRLKGPWRSEWRTVRARDLVEADKVAAAMPDVQQVYEVSFIPGGVVT